MKSIYISGPMSGKPNFNFPAFFTAQEMLEAQGWVVWNPAAKDMEKDPAIVDNPTGDPVQAMKAGFDIREAFRWDAEKICESQGIYMLRGWEQSPGARAEHAIAIVIQKHLGDEGMKIIYE